MIGHERQPFTFGKFITGLIPLALVMGLATGGIYFYNLSRERSIAQNPEPTLPPPIPTIKAVAALGRLEPQGEITRLSAPASLEGTRIEQILIKEGDKIQQGQVVAILDSRDRRIAALEKAKTDVKVARANLAIVKAGAKTGDINAQQEKISRLEAELNGQINAQRATIARLKAELRNAELENTRYQQLYQEGAIAESEADNKRLRVETTQELLNEANAALERTIETLQIQRSEAQATLNSIAEVRPVDVQLAQAELDRAIASAKQAEEDLAQTYIKAPTSGQILKVHVRAGEVIGTQGIAEIGQTSQMNVIAQVYETDIAKVKPGQKVVITGAAFPGKLAGEVSKIGLQVNKQNVFDNDPLVNTDNKVVEATIRLDEESSQQVAGFSNLQVKVVILL